MSEQEEIIVDIEQDNIQTGGTEKARTVSPSCTNEMRSHTAWEKGTMTGLVEMLVATYLQTKTRTGLA